MSGTTGDIAASPTGAARPLTRVERVVVGLAVVLLPVVAVATARLRRQSSGLDPMFYLGYVHDYPALAARFGQTYHGNRLSYLLIDRAGALLLGMEAGYLAVRVVMLVVAAAAAAAIGRRFGGAPLALVLAALVTVAPWLVNQLMWTQYDGFTAVHALVAVAALVAPRTRRAAWQVVAGAAIALSINGNIVLVLVWALALPALVVLWRDERLGDALAGLGRVVLGLGLTFVALSATLRVWYPDGPWFSETVAIQELINGIGDPTWFVPLPDAVRGAPVLIAIAVLLVLVWVAVARTAGDADREAAAQRLTVAVWLTLLAVALLVLHFGYGSQWLGQSYYRIHLLPVTLLAVAALAALGMRALDERTAWVLTGAVTAVLVLLRVVPVGGRTPLLVAAALAALAALLGTLAPAARTNAVALAAAVPLLLGLTLAPSDEARERSADELAAANAYETDLLRAAIGLQDVIEANVPTDRTLRFWHTVEGESAGTLTSLNMVYYGTGQGRLHRRADKGYGGMPDLEDGSVVELVDLARPVTVVLLGTSRLEVGDGYGALVGAGFAAEPVTATVLEGETFDVHVLLIAID